MGEMQIVGRTVRVMGDDLDSSGEVGGMGG